MALALGHSQSLFPHPLDVVEQTLADYDWPQDRTSDEEISVRVPGKWCDWNLYFTWSNTANAVQLSCAFDVRVPDNRLSAAYELLSRMNEALWMGHFCLWTQEGVPLFRHALPLSGTDGPAREQVDDVIKTAVRECERFFPALQYVLWGGRSASEAVNLALFETQGEA